MGLGKTIQLIATMLGNKKDKTLIVLPNSIIRQWESEIKRFAPKLNVLIFHGPNRTKNPRTFDLYDVVLAPYSVMVVRNKPKGTPTVMHKIRWGRIILDEGHEIRNPKSKLALSLKNIYADIKWVVTGTPVYNSKKDYEHLCKFIGLGSFTKQIKDQFLLRRTKEDLPTPLPRCDFANVELEWSKEEKDLYFDVYKDCLDLLSAVRHASMIEYYAAIFVCLLRCRQVLIHPQIYIKSVNRQIESEKEKLEDWVHESTKFSTLFRMMKEHPEEKTIIFCQFIEEIELLKEMLGETMNVYTIHGSITIDNRDRQVSQFKEYSGDKQSVFLIQIKAGGQGLNLQEASRVYIMAPSWNPATELQAIARSHRTGQTREVIVRKLIYSSSDDELPSIEESLMELQGHKAVISSEILNDPKLASQIPVKANKKSIRVLKKLFSKNNTT
jgi:SNF2 family DNA or RNA helicase